MKRPVISERMFLYWADREHPNTCRMTVRMQDAIELTMMQKALIVWTRCPPWQHAMRP